VLHIYIYIYIYIYDISSLRVNNHAIVDHLFLNKVSLLFSLQCVVK